jgi:hypothetical protein
MNWIIAALAIVIAAFLVGGLYQRSRSKPNGTYLMVAFNGRL